VQIHRVNYKNVQVSEFSTFQECQLIRDVLYLSVDLVRQALDRVHRLVELPRCLRFRVWGLRYRGTSPITNRPAH